MSATSRAEIGSRGFACRSCRAYGKSGTTAVMRLADASFAAWIISISSIRFRSTGMLPVCTRKMSAPRIDSLYRQYVSSFLNVSSSTPPSSRPRCSAIAAARSGCERPANTISRFSGPRSIQCPEDGSVIDAFSSPGRASSAVSVRLSMLVVDPAFLGFLTWRESGERSGGDIICDDRTRCNPSIVANVDRSIEHIVDTGPDVAADMSRALRQSRLVREVGRDVARRDVRILPDLRVHPRRGRIDDRDAGEHVRLVDPVAKARRDERKLGTGVDTLDLPRDRRSVHGDHIAATDEQAQRVGDIQLALRVVRRKPVENRPQLLGAEDVDPRVGLTERELGGRRVGRLDDPGEPAVAV